MSTFFRTNKNAENPFVMMDKRPVENPELSWSAKGLLSYLLSRPDGWKIIMQDLINRSTDGEHAVRGIVKELVDAGHLVKKEVRDEKGQFVEHLYDVYEQPTLRFSTSGFPTSGLPTSGKSSTSNTDISKKEINNPPAAKPDFVDAELKYHLQPKAIKDSFAKYFKLTPNWEAKYNRQYLEWMVQQEVTPEQVQLAADVWKQDKRFNWQVPTLKGIQEHWTELIANSNQGSSVDWNKKAEME